MLQCNRAGRSLLVVWACVFYPIAWLLSVSRSLRASLIVIVFISASTVLLFIFNISSERCRKPPALQLCDAIPTAVETDHGVLCSHWVKGRDSRSLSLASGPFSSIWNVAAKISFLPERLAQDVGWSSLLLWTRSSDLWLKPVTVYFSAFIELWSSSSFSSHIRHFSHCCPLLSSCAAPAPLCHPQCRLRAAAGLWWEAALLPTRPIWTISVPNTSAAKVLLEWSLDSSCCKEAQRVYFSMSYILTAIMHLMSLCSCTNDSNIPSNIGTHCANCFMVPKWLASVFVLFQF